MSLSIVRSEGVAPVSEPATGPVVPARADSEAAFDALVRDANRRLLRSGYLLTGSWSSAQDLVQTALMQTWTHWDRIRDPAAAEAYCRTCMVRTSASWWRRKWTGEHPTEELPERPTPGSDYDDIDVSRVVVEALRRLDARSRAVLVLRYVEDRPEQEVAELLGVSVGTVKSRASRAIAKLREMELWEGVGAP